MSLYLNGNKIASAYIGGNQVISRTQPACYGTLHLIGTDGTSYNETITSDDDWNLLFNTNYDFTSNTRTISFSFGDVLSDNVKGFTFNTDESTSYVSETINEGFLSCFVNITKSIIIPSWVKTIGSGFMYNDTNYNSDIIIPDSVTTIGNDFMCNCTSFNSSLTLSSNLYQIGNNFMSNTAYNSNINCNATIIGSDFIFNETTIFSNKELTFNNLKNLSQLFYNCNTSFNNVTINLPNVETVSELFCYLQSQSTFNYLNINIGNSINSINNLFGGNIFYLECNNLNITFNRNTNPLTISNSFNGTRNEYYLINLILSTIDFTNLNTFNLNNCFNYGKFNNLNLKLSANAAITGLFMNNIYPVDTSNYDNNKIYIEFNNPVANSVINDDNFKCSSYRYYDSDNNVHYASSCTFVFTGTYASEWKEAYPDIIPTSSDLCRKIILG